MGVEVYTVLENESEECAKFRTSGHWFAKVIVAMEKVAKKGKVHSLFDFYCPTREQSILELGGDPEDPSSFNEKELPEEVWFKAEDALETVQFYIQHIQKNKKQFDNADNILEDLNEFERILNIAKSNKIRWHLGQSV
jgi:hypothetical protein